MTSRQLMWIFTALAVLLVGYAGMRLASGDGERAGGDPIVTATSGGFTVIRMIGPNLADSVQLEQAGGGWTVNGYPADTMLVRQLADGLDTARVGRLVARSAANHARLGLDRESAWRVVIGPSEDPDVAFLVGGGGPDGRYARFPPSDEVFTIPAASVRLLGQSVDEWRDRVVAAVDTSAVRRIAVRRNDQPGPVILKRGSGDLAAPWTVDGSAPDTAVVQALLRESARLIAGGFPSDSVVYSVDFDDPAAVLEMFDSEATGAAPAVALLFVSAPDAADILVRRADDPLVYRISAAQARRLLPLRPALLPETTP